MKVELKIHVEFAPGDDRDLYASLQVDHDEHLVSTYRLAEIYRRQARGLNRADQAHFKNSVIKKLKKFLRELED